MFRIAGLSECLREIHNDLTFYLDTGDKQSEIFNYINNL